MPHKLRSIKEFAVLKKTNGNRVRVALRNGLLDINPVKNYNGCGPRIKIIMNARAKKWTPAKKIIIKRKRSSEYDYRNDLMGRYCLMPQFGITKISTRRDTND
jgi:hypothetical protein